MENLYYVTPEQYEIAEQNGIPAHAVYRRVHNENWSVQRAITQPIGKKAKPLWPEWKEIATRNGVKHMTFVQRVTKQKWSPEKAATTPPMPKQELIKKNAKKRKDRVLTDEQIARAKANGVSYRALHNRHVERGMDIEEAITTPILSRPEIIALAREKRKHDSYLRRSIAGYWNEKKHRSTVSS